MVQQEFAGFCLYRYLTTGWQIAPVACGCERARPARAFRKGISALFIRVRNRFYFRNSVRLSAEPFLLMKMEKQYVFMLLSGIINYTG